MTAFPFATPQLKIAMIVAGLAVGIVDVKESGDKLKEAMHERSARAIGEQMFIADPFFIAKAWRDHLSACGANPWCYIPPPPPPKSRALIGASAQNRLSVTCVDDAVLSLNMSLDSLRKLPPVTPRSRQQCLPGAISLPDVSAIFPPSPSPRTPNAQWLNMWPVSLARMAVFPVVQSGWTLFRHGWTARIVFLISLLCALGIASSASGSSDSLPGSVIAGVASFLIVSIVVSFAFNLLLRAGNFVAGYWGVLVAIASGIYFSIELAMKVRELIHVAKHGSKE